MTDALKRKTNMKKFLALGILLATACGGLAEGVYANDSGVSPTETTTVTMDGNIMTVTYTHYPEPPTMDMGSDSEALTITDSEGSIANLDNTIGDTCGGVFIPSPGICLYPRDKVTAYFNGIPAGTDAVLGTNVHTHFDNAYADVKVQLNGSGWNIATNPTDTSNIGGDSVFLRTTSCPGGCLGHTTVKYDVSDSRCSTRNGNRYCPSAAATGCLTELFRPDMVTDMANKFVTTAAHKATYIHNNVRHEVGHCLGLPHLDNSPTDIMFPFFFSFSEVRMSGTEVTALKTFQP